MLTTWDKRVGDFKADELYCAVRPVMHGIRFNDNRRTGLRRHQNQPFGIISAISSNFANILVAIQRNTDAYFRISDRGGTHKILSRIQCKLVKYPWQPRISS